MRCVDLDEFISAYADEQLMPAQAEMIEAHLAGCGRCQAVLRRQQQTRRLIARLCDERWTPPDMRLRVAYAYRRQKPAWYRRGLPVARIAVASLALLTVGLLGGHALAPSLAPVASGHITAIRSTNTPALSHWSRRTVARIAAQEYDTAAPPSSAPYGGQAVLTPLVIDPVALKGGGENRTVQPGGGARVWRQHQVATSRIATQISTL